VPGDQVEQVRRWIENYHQVKQNLEKDLRHQSGTDASPQGQEQEEKEPETMSHPAKEMSSGVSPILQPYG
jgi:hypothetical protein